MGGTENNNSDGVKSVFNPETGITSNFYGGEGRDDGPYHGHTDVDSEGNVTYHREPGEKY